ncbi:AraC family transcriptional regulator [Ascidiimonas aurantiaca]|uniref:helix-turn-helix transcriptional regulator n=1 Tax=Ascidiimonas aurantiaca TaxID=1685432 RepID=UPI0030ED8D1F
MTEINITAEDTAGTVKQIQEVIGGRIEERWGEHILHVSGSLANGIIRFITFDWGVSLLEYDITFYDDIKLIMDASRYNPIHFAYCLEGYCKHRFEYQSENEVKTLEQFQSVIITSRKGGLNFGYFPKNVPLEINVIQITRKSFLKKRLNGVELLNNKLYEVFHDLDDQNTFAFYGAYDLRLADKISALRSVTSKGMIRIMQIEGLIYQILSNHIADHEQFVNEKRLPTTLLNRELKIARDLAKQIVANPSKNYRLDELSLETGLSQAKLQEAFKLLYTRTVTEYIRHVRLEAARDYLRETDMNISQVVYSVGFSSRSYFSKIFKAKYNISPSDFKENVLAQIEVST